MTTINISPKTEKRFSVEELEKFINSEDFEDIILAYQMIKWETWKRETLSSFRKNIWI